MANHSEHIMQNQQQGRQGQGQQQQGKQQNHIPDAVESDRSKGLNPDQRGPAQPDEDRDGPERRD